MSKLDWVIENRAIVEEKDLLELREELREKKRNNQLDADERIALKRLEKSPINVEGFKMLLELGF